MAGLSMRQEIGFAFLCGSVTGGVVVAAVLDRRLKAKYEELANAEIAEMKEHYREKERELVRIQEDIARQPKPNLDAMMEDLKYKPQPDAEELGADELITGDVGGPGDPTSIDEEEEVDSKWDYRDVWDYDREVRNRSREIPFVLHKDEFDAEEEATQVTLTYFEGDDVLVDEKDEVITKKDEVVGMDNLNQFGHGSGDPNVVYVRNAHLGVDYEILRHKGHYASEVLGLEEESLEHSDMPRRRMRFDDDG
jgi:hypothetical protein